MSDTREADDLAADARRLLARHADLLTGRPPHSHTTAQREATEALDAARERLRGGPQPVAAQLALDLRPDAQ